MRDARLKSRREKSIEGKTSRGTDNGRKIEKEKERERKGERERRPTVQTDDERANDRRRRPPGIGLLARGRRKRRAPSRVLHSADLPSVP